MSNVTNATVNNDSVMTNKEIIEFDLVQTTQEEKDSLKQILDVDHRIENLKIQKHGKGEILSVTMHLHNYRSTKTNVEFDRLRANIKLTGVQEHVVIKKIKGTDNEYIAISGHHRTSCCILDDIALPVRIEVGTFELTPENIVRLQLGQTNANIGVKADTRDTLATVVKAFKTGIPVKEIQGITGIGITQIQHYLNINNKSKDFLERLGFDLSTNPFTITQLKTLVPFQKYAERSKLDEMLELYGSMSYCAKFIVACKSAAELEEKQAQDTEREGKATEDTKTVLVTETVTEKNSDTGKIETKKVEKEIIIDKKETLITVNDATALWSHLVVFEMEIEFKRYFTFQ